MARTTEAAPGAVVPSPVIMVVEDEELVRCAVAAHLTAAGFSVVEFGTALDAMAAVVEQPAIDLVFTDINMPGKMDGRALAKWLAGHDPGIPVIVTSGAELPDPGATLPNRRFMSKPYALCDLESQIRQLLPELPKPPAPRSETEKSSTTSNST